MVAGTAVAIAASWGGAYFLPGAVAGTLAGVAALLRHRGRLRAAAAGMTVAVVAVVVATPAGLPAEPGPAVSLALGVLLGSVTRVAPLRVVAWTAAAGLIVVAAGAFTRPGESGAFAVTMFGVLAWAAGLLTGVGLRLLDARRLAAVEAVRRDERLTMARELHDVVAHHVTGIVVQAQAGQLVARKNPAKAGESLAGIEAAGTEALAAVRRVVGVLREDKGEGTGDGGQGVSAGRDRIADLVWRFERIGPPVHLDLPPHEDLWPAEVAGAVHRVVQESLTNVVRHAEHARAVTVALSEVDGTVTVLVADDGESAPIDVHGGYGIVGMRERVEALGGTLAAGPAPGGGWQVQGTLPLPGPPHGPRPGQSQDSQLGSQDGAQSGSQDGAQSGSQDGAQSGSQDGAQPGLHDGSWHGSRSGAQPGLQAGARHDSQSGLQDGSQHGLQGGSRHGSQSSSQHGLQHGPESGSQHGPEHGPVSGSR
jgi:signal transduction histidine kinase